MSRFAVAKGFENNDNVVLPTRGTTGSAGYDFVACESITIDPGEIKLIPTGIKCYLEPYEFLGIYARSSTPIKRGLMMSNGVGVIDSDYADNPDNDGAIMGQFYNFTNDQIVILAGERIFQGIIQRFTLVEDDVASGYRMSGHGSTGV